MSFHERPVVGGRADGYVIKKSEESITKMIVEVKHYKKITDTTVRNAIKQGLNYLETIIQEDKKFRDRSSKDFRYVLLVVFSKDYPVKLMNVEMLGNSTSYPIEIIYCSVKNLRETLQKHRLIDIQMGLEDFF